MNASSRSVADWLGSASPGVCGTTENGDRGDCEAGHMGWLGYLTASESLTWETAVAACLSKCGGCARCQHISVSLEHRDCSWYNKCCKLSTVPPADRFKSALAVADARREVGSRGVLLPGGLDGGVLPRVRSRPDVQSTRWHGGECAAQGQRPFTVPSDDTRPLVLIGVLTHPINFDCRAWLRKHMFSRAGGLLPEGRARRTIGHVFAYGAGCPMSAGQRLLWRQEQRKYAWRPGGAADGLRGDMWQLNVSDCTPQTFMLKTFAWFRDAAGAFPEYRWLAKMDDDSLVDPRKLRHDLLHIEAIAARCSPTLPTSSGPHALYGPMRWRKWDPESNSVCGEFSEADPSDGPPADNRPRRKRHLPESCSVGPFPYVDGSLTALSVPLARAVFREGDVSARFIAQV
jgi:hypothetical protein